jgi:RNA polymerase sigma factor (sigma-70 family)
MDKDKQHARSSCFRFPHTPWTLICDAMMATATERRDILGQLVQCYWKPLYAYYRAKGKSRADAEDLVQGLLGRLATQEDFLPARGAVPTFRAWLLKCARNHLVDAIRHEGALKRDATHGVMSLDRLRSEHGDAFEPTRTDAPDHAFRAAWRQQLLERALNAVKVISDEVERRTDFDIFIAYYAAEPEKGATWKEIAARYGLSDWKLAARKADWVKEQLGRAIRNEIRSYVLSDEEVDNEIRDLVGTD